MSDAERIQVDGRMDNLAAPKKIRSLAHDRRLASSHRTRDDQQRFRKRFVHNLQSFHAFPASAIRNPSKLTGRELFGGLTSLSNAREFMRLPDDLRLICGALRSPPARTTTGTAIHLIEPFIIERLIMKRRGAL